MPGLADFDVPTAKKHAQAELAAAVKGNTKPFPKLFMPELKDEEVGQYVVALTFNEFGWFLLALVATMRGVAAYGYKNLHEAMKADAAFVDQRLADYMANIARPHVLEWAGLWKAVTDLGHASAKHAKSGTHTVVNTSFDALVADMMKALGDAMPAIGEARKKIADLRSRLEHGAPEPVPGTMARLADGLEKLENTLLNELAANPSKPK